MSNYKSIDDYLILKNVGGTPGQNWNSDSRDRGIMLILFHLLRHPNIMFLDFPSPREQEVETRQHLIIHELSSNSKYMTIG